MAIKTDHRDMPRGAPEKRGEQPHPQVIFANSYALELAAERADKPHAMPGHLYRFSDAAGCARKLGYVALGVPPDPDSMPGPVDLHVMDAGTRGHDVVQRAFLHRYWDNETMTAERQPLYVPQVDAHTHWGIIGHCEFEVPCEIAGIGTGHADAWCPQGVPGSHLEGRPTVFELKHVGGFGYKLSIGERGAAQGPRWSAKVQGALCGEGLGAEVVVVANVGTEIVSKGLAAGKGIDEWHRGFAEWVYERDEWEPWVLSESARVRRLLAIVAEGGLPPRALSDPEVPSKARVVNPDRGAWVLDVNGSTVESGTWWGCGYCSHRPRCTADGPT